MNVGAPALRIGLGAGVARYVMRLRRRGRPMGWDDRISPMLDAFSEEATYTPASGDSRTIRVSVDRGELEGIAPVPDSLAPSFRVTARNDATTGIWSGDTNLTNGTLSLSWRSGGTPVAREIARVLEHDEQTIVLEVR